MYYKEDKEQIGIEEFFLPFGGKLKKNNRWVKVAEIMPWDYIEEVYLRSMNQETGRGVFPPGSHMVQSMCGSRSN